jgi:hypothetical protein
MKQSSEIPKQPSDVSAERLKASSPSLWRQGSRVRLNVYEGDRPVCQCHYEQDARRIVEALNVLEKLWPGKQ